MNDASAISISVPTDDDDADGDASPQEDGDDVSIWHQIHLSQLEDERN